MFDAAIFGVSSGRPASPKKDGDVEATAFGSAASCGFKRLVEMAIISGSVADDLLDSGVMAAFKTDLLLL